MLVSPVQVRVWPFPPPAHATSHYITLLSREISLSDHRTGSSVLFLCTGNYYRSRFSELWFNHLAERRELGWRAMSRALGLDEHPELLGPMAASAREKLAGLRVMVGPARLPIQVIDSELEAATLVVGIKRAEHEPRLAQKHQAGKSACGTGACTMWMRHQRSRRSANSRAWWLIWWMSWRRAEAYSGRISIWPMASRLGSISGLASAMSCQRRPSP